MTSWGFNPRDQKKKVDFCSHRFLEDSPNILTIERRRKFAIWSPRNGLGFSWIGIHSNLRIFHILFHHDQPFWVGIPKLSPFFASFKFLISWCITNLLQELFQPIYSDFPSFYHHVTIIFQSPSRDVPIFVRHFLIMFIFNQWEFQDPEMEVLYHIRPYFVGIFPYIGHI